MLCYFDIDIFISLCSGNVMSTKEIYQLLQPLFDHPGEVLQTK